MSVKPDTFIVKPNLNLIELLKIRKEQAILYCRRTITFRPDYPYCPYRVDFEDNQAETCSNTLFHISEEFLDTYRHGYCEQCNRPIVVTDLSKY